MPLHKVKSRIRFQGLTKRVKQDGGEKVQRKPTRTVFDGAWNFTLAENVIDSEPLFTKKRVPSTDELGDVLRSNLHSSLAAVNACEAQREAGKSPPSPTCQQIERQQEEDDNAPASLPELALPYRVVPERLLAADTCTTGPRNGREDNGPSASFLAITAIHRAVNNVVGPANPRAVTAEGVNKRKEFTALYEASEEVYITKDGSKLAKSSTVVNENESSDPPVSLLATADILVAPSNDPEPGLRAPLIDLTAANTYIIEDDDGAQFSPLAETRQCFIEQIKPAPRSSTNPFKIQKHRSNFLQRVVTLFAGSRRCQAVKEELPSAPSPLQEQHGTAVPSSSPRLPQLHSKQDQPIVPQISPNTLRPLPPPRQATIHFGGTTPRGPTPRKNLPLSPPIIVLRRPYRPINEHLNAPFIEAAEEHRYTGTHFVASDVFQPAVVQLGFPSAASLTSPILPVRRQNSDAQLLDRDGTVWAKWYAKNPTAEHMPFAKANSTSARRDRVMEDATEQQVWDSHATQHAKFREVQTPLTSNEDISRHVEDAEQEHTARLRHHPGHCFGALTGDVYPFQGGLII